MYYTIYKVTNIINGKFYIGMHKTKRLDDGYMGSGKLLKRAICKHGLDHFIKEILFNFDNAEDMYAKEIELITEELIKNPLCYNLTMGGWGGNRITDPNHHTWTVERMTQASLKAAEKPRTKRQIIAAQTNVIKARLAITEPAFLRRTHSEATKAKMREFARKRIGEKNSQYGKIWITNGVQNQKIHKDDSMPDGWYKGRIFVQ